LFVTTIQHALKSNAPGFYGFYVMSKQLLTLQLATDYEIHQWSIWKILKRRDINQKKKTYSRHKSALLHILYSTHWSLVS